MNINVRYFASMRDRVGRAEDRLDAGDETMTVADLWSRLSGGQALPTSTLIAVNMEYTDGNHKVKGGDEVAFFPPVTGG